MFEWLSSPSCPCDPLAKAWIERCLAWLSEQFPSNVFTGRPLVLPTPKFFPETYEPSKQAAKELLRRVCHFMGVSEDHVILKFYHEPSKVWLVHDDGDWVPPATGTYERSGNKYVIRLDTNQIYQPDHVIATIAHELAHARLLGEGRQRRFGHDAELLTDLTACFLGFAIFMANSPRVWTSRFSTWPGTELSKPEHMSAPMHGYLLGLLAWFQNKPKPLWTKFLGPQVVFEFKQATRFLFKTEDSSFRPKSRWGRRKR
jgi:hypothetical protein